MHRSSGESGRGIGRAVCLGLAFLCGPATAQAGIDGVTYTTRYFELVKRVAPPRSVIYPGYQPDAAALAQQESEVRAGLAQLAGQLEGFLLQLRGPDSPYPLLDHAILEYQHLNPIEQTPERGRMYIMYVGELHWPFPAPLFADLLRIRVTHAFPQPLRDLLTTALFRWGRDHLDRAARDTPEQARLKAAVLLREIADAEVFKIRWRHDRVVNELLELALTPAEIAKLSQLAGSGEPVVRVAALRVLGNGGHLTDPGFYGGLLADPVPEARHAAFWALVQMREGRGLVLAQGYAGRAHAFAARLKEVRPSITNELVAAETLAFDQAVAALTRKPSPPADPYTASPAPPPPVPPPALPAAGGDDAAPGDPD